MEMRNCPRCKKAFLKIKDPICPPCTKEEEAIFETVRDYIKTNPGLGINDVAMAVEVSPKKIQRYIRDGLIDITESEALMLHCDSCGTFIYSGRYCEKCTLMIKGKVDGFIKDEKDKKMRNFKDSLHANSNKMFTADESRRKK
jgi:hypothetical protein